MDVPSALPLANASGSVNASSPAGASSTSASVISSSSSENSSSALSVGVDLVLATMPPSVTYSHAWRCYELRHLRSRREHRPCHSSFADCHYHQVPLSMAESGAHQVHP